MHSVAWKNLGLQSHVIYDSWMVLINLWMSVGDIVSPAAAAAAAAAADVRNMKQLSRESFPLLDLSCCVAPLLV